MSELNKLIEENKSNFEIKKDVLTKKVDYALMTYDMAQPTTNLDSISHARVSKNYPALVSMLIDSAEKLSAGYTLIPKDTRRSTRGYKVVYLKGETQQAKDKTNLKKQVKQDYLAELELVKEKWISDLTQNLAKQAEAEARVIAQNKTKQIQEELTALLSTK